MSSLQPRSLSNGNTHGVPSSTDVVDDASIRPSITRINIDGAFIVDDGSATPEVTEGDGSIHDSNDIRLPHHTAVVSHVAIDVWQA